MKEHVEQFLQESQKNSWKSVEESVGNIWGKFLEEFPEKSLEGFLSKYIRNNFLSNF